MGKMGGEFLSRSSGLITDECDVETHGCKKMKTTPCVFFYICFYSRTTRSAMISV